MYTNIVFRFRTLSFGIVFRVMKHHAIQFFYIQRNEYGRCARLYA
jgi:hypothetical protein